MLVSNLSKSPSEIELDQAKATLPPSLATPDVSPRQGVTPSQGFGLHVLIRSSIVAVIGGITGQAVKFLLYIYLARRFSSADFGLVAFGTAVYAFIYIIAHAGLPVFGTREVAKLEFVPNRLLFVIAGLRVVLGLTATLAAVVALTLVPGTTRRECWFVGLFGLSNVPLAGFCDWAFQGLRKLTASALLNVIWQVLWFVFVWVGILLGIGVVIVPAALCASALVVGALSLLWLRGTGLLRAADEPARSLWNECWNMLKLGAPLGIGTMLITVLIWTDVIFVRMLRGPQEAGHYAAGNRAALAVAMLASFYIQGVFPFFSRAVQEGQGLFRRYFQHAYDDLSLAFVPGAVWGAFNATAVMRLFFKRPEYVAAAHVFQIFQMIAVLIVLNALFGTGILVAFHRDRAYQNVLLATVVFFLLICPLLTHLWSIVGAALAALAAQMFAFICFLSSTRSFLKPAHLQALVWPCIAGLAAGLASWILRLSLAWACLLLVVAYAALALAHIRRVYRNFDSAGATS